jgi:alcohol dehydrogenase
MPTQREAWWMPRAGSLDRLELRREPAPEPGSGEVRVRVAAIGLNFADVFAALGLYSATPKGAFVPGLECAGVVDAVGPPVQGRPLPALGDRVVAVTRFGGYASEVVVDARQVHPLPATWSYAEGAAWPVQALTAWYALFPLGAVEAGDCVLVHSAAGGVGLHALDLAGAAGARVIATVGRSEKRDFLVAERGLAPGSVVVRERRRFGGQLDAAMKAVGARGLDLVLDAILGPYFRPAFDRLAPEGRHVVFGAADLMPAGSRPSWLRLGARWLRRPRIDPLAMVSENRAVFGFNLVWMWEAIDRLPLGYAELARLGRHRPHVGARLPFARAPEAMRLLQGGGTIGKVVLEIA